MYVERHLIPKGFRQKKETKTITYLASMREKKEKFN
jgi:hypothetical protein